MFHPMLKAVLLFLWATLLTAAAGGRNRGLLEHEHVHIVRDIKLPAVSAQGANATADVYFCDSQHRQPLAVLLPGALGNKAWYKGFSSRVACSAGVVVLVAQQPGNLPQFGIFDKNLVTRYVVAGAIAWAKSVDGNGRYGGELGGLRVDTEHVYLLAHSLGAVEAMALMNSTRPDRAAAPRQVRAAWVWGYTLYIGSFSPVPYLEHTTNRRGPFMVQNGEGDYVAAFPPYVAGTYARLSTPKVYTVLDKLDHFSIADRNWTTPINRANDTVSTLSRHVQVAVVARGAITWLRSLPGLCHQKARSSVCRQLEAPGFLAPSSVVSCRQHLCS